MRGSRPAPSDEGFTLVEAVVSTLLITIMMGALTTFFISSTATVRVQGGRQIAAQLANDAVDRARKLRPTLVIMGRDQQSVDAQWQSPVAGVSLASMQKVYDPSATAGAGPSATLRTTYESTTLSGVTYQQRWYVGRCWQPPGGGACSATEVPGHAVLYRVIVAVTWADRACHASSCAYVTSTLISAKPLDPLFNLSGA